LIQLPLLWSSNILPPLGFVILCCLRKSCVAHSVQMVSPLLSLYVDIPHYVDITQLNHYAILNMVSFERPADGVRNFIFFFILQSCLSYFLQNGFFGSKQYCVPIYVWVRTQKCAWALTTDELMKITNLHIFIHGLNMLST
jgi:hypothetical protein